MLYLIISTRLNHLLLNKNQLNTLLQKRLFKISKVHLISMKERYIRKL